jgi:hypothetical protein
MRVPHFEEEWAVEMVNRVTDYMASLDDGLYDEDADFTTLTGAPYCGCEVCVERERTFAIVMFTLEGAERGLVRLEEVS